MTTAASARARSPRAPSAPVRRALLHPRMPATHRPAPQLAAEPARSGPARSARPHPTTHARPPREPQPPAPLASAPRATLPSAFRPVSAMLRSAPPQILRSIAATQSKRPLASARYSCCAPTAPCLPGFCATAPDDSAQLPAKKEFPAMAWKLRDPAAHAPPLLPPTVSKSAPLLAAPPVARLAPRHGSPPAARHCALFHPTEKRTSRLPCALRPQSLWCDPRPAAPLSSLPIPIRGPSKP